MKLLSPWKLTTPYFKVTLDLCNGSHCLWSAFFSKQIHFFVVLLLSCVQLFCDPMDCNLPDSSVCRIIQARILEWVAISSSSGFPDPGIEPRSPVLQVDSLLQSHQGNTSYPSLCFSLNSFYNETSRTWASLSPETRSVTSVRRPWV